MNVNEHIEDGEAPEQALFQNQITVGASEVSDGNIPFMHIYFDTLYFVQSIVYHYINQCDFERECPIYMQMSLPKLCSVYAT